ncbi:glycosyltransferase [Patescibacteria group bacterium]|nr:glycosyltransferase [Patescibacteria group bacterium]
MGGGQVKVKIVGNDGCGWSIDQDHANADYLLKTFDYQLVRSFFSASHIYCVWLDLLLQPRYRWLIYFRKFFNKKLIGVVTNDITNNPEKIPFIKKHIDVCVAPSRRVENFLAGYGIKTIRIPFFVRPNIIKKLDCSKVELTADLQIDFQALTGRTVIGSFQRDSLGADLSQQKWQKNPEHLVQILKQLPVDKFVLLLAGPRRHYIIRRCREENIPFVFCGDIEPVNQMKDDIAVNTLSLSTINRLYNLCDVYVVTSKSEGGPKAVLEAAMAETLVISSDVGLASDILHSDLIFGVDDVDVPVKLLLSYLANSEGFNQYIKYNKNQVDNELSLEKLKEQYVKLFSV